jgi:hypothetical protein
MSKICAVSHPRMGRKLDIAQRPAAPARSAFVEMRAIAKASHPRSRVARLMRAIRRWL